MSKLSWDQVGERTYETGVDHGVLYLPDDSGNYDTGVPWNGLTTVTETPAGAEATPQFADNIKYLNLVSTETLGGTIEAFTYPDEFGVCDGTIEPNPGVKVGQQSRRSFGMSYRTLLGNDVAGQDYGYKLHLLYGALAAPSEKAYATVNDSPSAIAFSWGFSTSPVAISTQVDGKSLKPTSLLVIDSTLVDADALSSLEDALYGTTGSDARLPSPDDVLAFFSGSVTEVTPTAPTYVEGTHTLTIPTVAGVVYRNAETGAILSAGAHVIAVDTEVKAYPTAGNSFPDIVDDEWVFPF